MLNAALETVGAVPSSQIADRTAAGDSDDQKIAAPSELTAKFKQYASTKDGDAIPVRSWKLVRDLVPKGAKGRGAATGAGGEQVRYSEPSIISSLSPLSPLCSHRSAELEARLADVREAEEQRRYRELSITSSLSPLPPLLIPQSAELEARLSALKEAEEGRRYRELEAPSHHFSLSPPSTSLPTDAELEARLAALKEAEEQRQYRELVRDVVPKGAKGRGAIGGAGGVDDEEDFGGQGGSSYLASYREQLGFGMHVVGVMFTCYLLGHFAASALIKDQPALHPVGGAVGLIFGMLLETTLFIIRTTQLEEKQAKQRSKKAARKQGVSVPPLTAGWASSQGIEMGERSAGVVSVGFEEVDAVRQELIELAGRRQKGAGVSSSSGGSIMRRRIVRQSDGD
ncbi:unnamed protein product [Closterium sp. Naga37s-1]|nr:unnamed protein product [Closterium sp. Naga37s-1]